MAPFTVFTALAGILALSTSVSAQTGTGTGTGLPIASATLGAPYPLSNATLPAGPAGTGIGLPTGLGSPSALPFSLPGTSPSGLPGSPIESGASCPVPITVTTTNQVTVTVTVIPSSAAAPTTPASVPYPIPGSSGLLVGTGIVTRYGTGTGTGTGTGYAMATGYSKRMEMRGLKQERREWKRGASDIEARQRMKNVTMKRDQMFQRQSSIFHNLPAGPLPHTTILISSVSSHDETNDLTPSSTGGIKFLPNQGVSW
ncbi:hypothetical protein HO133_008101 [Letharia lupina]|uniref:Uncharacterized protein n=1 Tax=Letharia lupina TaxID=560253 RepID=A0A8H6CS60_9LECA|nr:uncharacterized protein HO133_008101 [Letharia lupina]KAF6228371.1 hypothetical protein HO133_008101 [Letharia lupina]